MCATSSERIDPRQPPTKTGGVAPIDGATAPTLNGDDPPFNVGSGRFLVMDRRSAALRGKPFGTDVATARLRWLGRVT